MAQPASQNLRNENASGELAPCASTQPSNSNPHLRPNSRPIVEKNIFVILDFDPKFSYCINQQRLPERPAQGIVSNTTQHQVNRQSWRVRNTRWYVKWQFVVDSTNGLILVVESCCIN